MEESSDPIAESLETFAPLTTEEVRVLGCLVEKAATTPDSYPLTVNTVLNACNQKSSRFPVVHYDEETVRRALDNLKYSGWVTLVREAGARVVKYRHEFRRRFEFSAKEVAILCVLMLRGPQTVGELRGRSERMAQFQDLSEVEETVRELATGYPQPLVKTLARSPGKKDIRYMHLLAGDTEPEFEAPANAPRGVATSPVNEERLDALEVQVKELKELVTNLQIEFEAFKQQFG